MGEIFEEVEGHIRDAYRELIDVNKPDGKGLDNENSVWHTLYGYETNNVLLKLREAMMWLQEAKMSVG